MKVILCASAPAIALLMVLLAGCASPPRSNEFQNVQGAVWDQTGKRVQWNRGSADDAEAASAVHTLLSRELTADSAVQVALLNNADLQATFEDLGIAQADLVQAGLLRNPVFFLSSRFPTAGGATDLELSVAQDFVDLLMLPLRKKVAAASFQASRGRVVQAVIELAAQMRSGFYTLQGAQQSLEMRRSIRDATLAALDAARKLREAGNIRELDLVNHQSLEQQAELELESADADVQEGRQRLNRLMGLTGDQTWTIDTRLPDLPGPLLVISTTLQQIALARRNDVLAARSEVEAAASQLRLAQPFAGFSSATLGIDGEQDPHSGWVVGPTLEIPVPLFDNGRQKVDRAKAVWRQAKDRYAAMAVNVRSEVCEAVLRMDAARVRAERYRTQILPLRQRIVEQTQLQYNAMQVGVFELIQARQSQIDAGREYVQSLLQYWLARSDLERAAGGRIESATAAGASSSPTTHPN